MLAAEHVEALARLLGEKAVLTETCDTAPYETGARYERGRAAAVLRPRTTAEVSAGVAYCVRHEIPLIPQSGNTGLVSGSTPDASGHEVILSLDRMTEIFIVDRDNRTLTASAGWRLSEVNSRLHEHTLHFPIDLGADPRLGGMLATNTGGSRFLKYGDVRRNTLGLQVVLADGSGTVLSLSNNLRKNNTGIDWKHLFIGTSGAFGVITECTLNIEPIPRQSATVYLVPRNEAQVMPLLRAMEEALGSDLSAFEGMSADAVRAALDHTPSLRNPFANGHVPPYVVLAEVTRSWEPRKGEQPLDHVLEQVMADIWEQSPDLLADAIFGQPNAMWALRHSLSEGVKHSGRLIAFDLSFRRGDVMAFCASMRTRIPDRFPGLVVCDFGHIGDGGVHFNLVASKGSPAASDPELERRLRDFVFKITVEEFDGSFSAEHGVGRKNQPYYDLYTTQTERDLARGLKDLLSPGWIGAARFG